MEPRGKGKGRPPRAGAEAQVAPNKASSCYMGTGLTSPDPPPPPSSAQSAAMCHRSQEGTEDLGVLFKSLNFHLASLAQALATLGLSFTIRQMGE